ncbi:MAG: sporulation integral membrane protein YtvI, partial [Clostridia bacterium]|nr:sporulation integral membrane protein YtvI [Clostridia bacterium]
LRRPINFLSSKLRIPRKGAVGIVLALFYIILAALFVGVIFGLISAAIKWIADIPRLYVANIQPALSSVLEWAREAIPNLNEEYEAYLTTIGTRILTGLYDVVSALSQRLLGFAQSFALKVPKTLIATLFSIVATVFLTLDWPNISHFIMGQFHDRGKNIINDSVRYVGESVIQIIKSYGLIMFITFIELCIGLTVLGVKNSIIYAFIIACFDIIPALGTGGIVIPWVIIELIYRHWTMAAGLAVMYIIITAVRNVLEPKIVGKSIGLHPVLMLFSMYMGATIFGGLGIIIMPFTFIVVKKLNDTGLIHLFNSDYLKEDPEASEKKKKKESSEV